MEQIRSESQNRRRWWVKSSGKEASSCDDHHQNMVWLYSMSSFSNRSYSQALWQFIVEIKIPLRHSCWSTSVKSRLTCETANEQCETCCRIRPETKELISSLGMTKTHFRFSAELFRVGSSQSSTYLLRRSISEFDLCLNRSWDRRLIKSTIKFNLFLSESHFPFLLISLSAIYPAEKRRRS